MSKCGSCGFVVEGGRFCSNCGAVISTDDVATLVSTDDVATAISLGAVAAPKPARSPRPASSSRSSAPISSVPSEGRFLPGTLLAGRYRLIALLGKGGMGEVYRADDLTLGQPVALKFLPEEASDDGLLERFKAEVRIARKVSHPNVCRVYDVGEVDGATFFTMEYVDGEDLASLLRRIGRLPGDKAVEIARQLCAGLAAAHSKGVLHRDLKPANIMLDGRGQVVITDFGLAAIAEQVEGAEIRSGTPAYMAPEQLAGKGVTTQSDLYALGLVLYEIFTGKRAFSGENLADLVRARTESQVSRPSSLVKDLDPLIERVILRCLEAEPAKRPASALSIAAALPGGDPLAAALAAGETPSPQMVAAAGETEGLKPKIAELCMAAAVIAIVIACLLNARFSAEERMSLEKSPDVLQQDARDAITRLGYDAHAVDTASDISYDEEMIRYNEAQQKTKLDWNNILRERPSLLLYEYRQSPRYMLPVDLNGGNLTPGVITYSDPPAIQSGMINLMLDMSGNLVEFRAIPPQVDDSTPTAQQPDWNILFALAHLDRSQYQTATPTWNSLANTDARAAWAGKWPGSDIPLRIEAGAWHGKIVFFSLISPWTRPERMQPFQSTKGEKTTQILLTTMVVILFLAAAFAARRNYRRGRGDPEGALRLSAVVFIVQILLWVFFGHFVPKLDILVHLVIAISTGLFVSGFIWMTYLALEPWVRKHWPHSIIAWTRLLSGKVRDPRVGTDVLIGVLLGLLWVLIYDLRYWLVMRMGGRPEMLDTSFMMGPRVTLGELLQQIPGSILGIFFFFGALMILRVVLRNKWLAAAGFIVFWTAIKALSSPYPGVEIPMQAMIYGVAAFACVRFGLVTLAAAVVSADLLLNVPISFDFSRWYASTAMLVPFVVLALAIWSFYTSLGGQKIWKDELLD